MTTARLLTPPASCGRCGRSCADCIVEVLKGDVALSNAFHGLRSISTTAAAKHIARSVLQFHEEECHTSGAPSWKVGR